ncbi:MAG: ArsR/SmtB family transcription factor [Candidatus Nanohalobium sp.]
MQVFKALSDQTRYRILEKMLEQDRKVCICELKEYFDKDSSVIYRHIKKLENADLIETEKEGRKLICNVSRSDEVRSLLRAAQIIEKGEVPEEFSALESEA